MKQLSLQKILYEKKANISFLILRLRVRLAIRTRIKKVIRLSVYRLQQVPIFAEFAGKIKSRFPGAWQKVSSWLKRAIIDSRLPVDINTANREDKAHFEKLFRREIDQRKGNKGTL